MSKTESSSSSCAASDQAKCAPIGLLLFVGFIIGFSVGFSTHDALYKSLSNAMYGGKTVMSEPPISKTTEPIEDGKDNTTTESTDEASPTETPQTEEEKLEEVKPEEQKAE